VLSSGELYCKSCSPGFEHDGHGKCDELDDPLNCMTVVYSNPKQCSACNEGFEQVDSQDCVAVSDNCAENGTSGCNVCNNGFDSVNGVCENRDLPEGCEDVNWGDSAKTDECKECLEGWELNNGRCTESTRDADPNCAPGGSDSNGWCTECVEGFYPDPDGGCYQEIAGPDNCAEHTDGVCDKCEVGFHLVNGNVCEQDEDDNTEEDDSCLEHNGSVCTKCAEGLVHSDENRLVCVSPQHCEKIIYDGYCDTCEDGYYHNV
jgi:hypothetical protein